MIKLKDIINENKAPLNEAQQPFPNNPEAQQMAANAIGTKIEDIEQTTNNLTYASSYDAVEESLTLFMKFLLITADFQARTEAVAKKKLKPEEFDSPKGDKIGGNAAKFAANEFQIMFGKMMNSANAEVQKISKNFEIEDQDAPKGFFDKIKKAAKDGWDAGKADADSVRKQYGSTAKNPETAGKGMFGSLFK
jgi:hypothetical protein